MTSTPAGGSFIDIGLDKLAHIPQCVAPKTRLTLALGAAPVLRFAQEVSENVVTAEVGMCIVIVHVFLAFVPCPRIMPAQGS